MDDRGLMYYQQIGQRLQEGQMVNIAQYKNIASALVKAQKNFAPALKTSTNPHFRSRYADLAACVEAVIDSLNENGIALIQKTHDTESGVKVETCLIHESGEMLNCGILHVPASKNDPQGYGSALTYARRYSLMAACGIAPEDDDGNAGSRPAQKRQQEQPQKQKQELTPENKTRWNHAKIAYLRDGNLDKVLEHMTISEQNKEQLISECLEHP